MNRDELIKEIMRVEAAIDKTDSRYLKRDYGKYLKKLYRDLTYYNRSMKQWQTNRIS